MNVERFVVYSVVYLKFYLINGIFVPGSFGIMQNRLVSNSEIAYILV